MDSILQDQSNTIHKGIYLIIHTTPITHKKRWYIGSSININKRKLAHFAALKNNTHSNSKLQNIYNKYGESSFSFTIIENNINEDLLFQEEQKWIDKFLYKKLDLINLVLEVQNGFKSYCTEETRKKLSDTHKQLYKTDKAKKHLDKMHHLCKLKLGKPTPTMIHIKTKDIVEPCLSNRDLAKKLKSGIQSVSHYFNKKTKHVKGYVTIEDFNKGIDFIQEGKNKMKEVHFSIKVPRLFNIKTKEITESGDSVTDFISMYNINRSVVMKLLNKEVTVSRYGWTIYNPDIHITEFDYQYE